MAAPRQPTKADITDYDIWLDWAPNPTVQTVGSTPATLVVNSARYSKGNKTTKYRIDLSIVNQGVGNLNSILFDPPTTIAFYGLGQAIEYAATGFSGTASASVGTQKISTRRTDPATGGTTNWFTTGWSIVVQGEYENT